MIPQVRPAVNNYSDTDCQGQIQDSGTSICTKQNKPVVWTNFSTMELRSICSEIEKVMKTQKGNENEDVAIKVNLGKDVLTIKQAYLHGEPQNSIQYNGHTPCPINNGSLEELKSLLLSTIDRMEKDRAAKNYRNDPPIKKVDHSKACQAVYIIADNMKGWDAAITVQSTNATLGEDDERIAQEQWNTRLEDTRSVLSLVLREKPSEQKEYYVYEINNTPVGLMVLDTTNNPPYVDELVAHPGSQAAGGSLIEFAVNRSAQLEHEGKLSLQPVKNSITAYQAMGFMPVTAQFGSPIKKMNLDPVNNSKWCNDEGKWKLQSHTQKDKKYMWTAFDGADTPLRSTAIKG